LHGLQKGPNHGLKKRKKIPIYQKLMKYEITLYACPVSWHKSFIALHTPRRRFAFAHHAEPVFL